MNRSELYDFIRPHKYAVQASVAETGAPQAAVVGIVATPELEIFFDTFASSRKAKNLRRDARVALVIGWDEEQTVQLEGVADEPSGADLARLKDVYFARFPDGRERERMPEIIYFRVRPRWARYSDFRTADAKIVELSF